MTSPPWPNSTVGMAYGVWNINPTIDKTINGIVIEYLQTTNMSGPLHGLQNSVVGKTGGADNYYNNGYYQDGHIGVWR